MELSFPTTLAEENVMKLMIRTHHEIVFNACPREVFDVRNTTICKAFRYLHPINNLLDTDYESHWKSCSIWT